MTDRFLSQHGNVIAADFRPREAQEITVDLHYETLFVDGHVMLIRVSITFGGKSFGTSHLLIDLATGRIVQL